VAMNPAALKANLADLPRGGTVILDTDEFTARTLARVGYTSDPRTDGTLADVVVHPVPMSSLTRAATEAADIGKKAAQRAKNMFALGLLSWMYGRELGGT
ncbi:2-oxoacid:acceptor oxidoreductase family protein, partial [Nocardia cyriacigeorgica]|uniref:2-oxoacid:acceptor oxidoreductase family protein n=1 Tax=Nocardia cyriacigeorgica TaxID=135487 RepID=UPI001894C545